LYEVIDDEENDKLYMGKKVKLMKCNTVMDYCSNGELLSWNAKTLRFRPFVKDLDHLPETDIKKYMRHLIRGLHYSKRKYTHLR
jgi:serine/threonine protein kinase